MGESVELTPYINAFKTAYNSNADLTESGNALIEQLQKIVTAADDFQTNGTNENLKEEMKPWVDSLRYLSKASIGFVKTAMGLKAGDDDAVCANYVSAENNYKLSQNCAAPQLNGTIMAEAGAMKIMPFAAQMENYVKKAAKYGRLRDFKNNRGIVVEVFLEEHGESIIYGLIGLVMVVTITAVISRGIVNIVPDYKKELSRNNSYQIEKNEYKYPTIIADEVIYADYGDTTFNYMDYIRARDYRGGNITDKVKVYGKVDVNQKGVYRLRCTVISYFNLACTKYINIIVE